MPLIAGIVNATGDSFSEGSSSGAESAPDRSLAMLEGGADLLDIGGESTRPGASALSPAEELRRLLPTIETVLARHPDTIISIDTRNAKTALECVSRGAAILNDVSMLRHDPGLAEVAAETGAGLVICHSRGTPDDMQSGKYFDYGGDIAATVAEELAVAGELARRRGVEGDRIWFDPGFGFAKTIEQNFDLARNIGTLYSLGPLWVGVSRKSFIGAASGEGNPARRLAGTLAMELFLAGSVDCIRTHDAVALRQALKVRCCLEPAVRGEKWNL